MKKICLLLFFALNILTATVYAMPSYDRIMSEKIGEYGIFNGTDGIVYADTMDFENHNSMLLVRIENSTIVCEVYDEIDGVQLTDDIKFPCGDKNIYKLLVISQNGTDYISISVTSNKQTATDFFTIQNDTFTNVPPINYDTATPIVTYENENFTSHIPSKSIFNFLNSQKELTIASYPFTNRVNLISPEETTKIKNTLASCADIMSFDIKDYDYDTLFKYILYTHKNFQILSDIPSDSGNSSSLGYNNVSLVRSDYIDDIMKNVFRITPEKPPVNNLLTRGFCYNDGYYYYTGGFDVFFSTQILDLVGVYDIGGGVTFVVFSDIYCEGDRETPEYSFAVLQQTENSYSLLRLGMGEALPGEDDIKTYSPYSIYSNANWKNNENKETTDNSLLPPLLLLIISVGTIGLICAIIALTTKK